MPKWNQFSTEVTQERATVRAYGLDNIMNRLCESDSYKAQALRQLAMRLELEVELAAARSTINRLIDQLEAADITPNVS